MKRSRLQPVSDKQKVKLALWEKITRERMSYLRNKYGFAICEYCGSWGYEHDNESPFYFRGHHMDRNRNNNTYDNCFISHNSCHQKIHDNNIKVTREV